MCAMSADADFCRSILPKVSRTFALSIEMLPTSLREAVSTAYLLCRIVDTIEDEPGLSGPKREALFLAFDAGLSNGDERAIRKVMDAQLDKASADGMLCERADEVFRAFRMLSNDEKNAIAPYVSQMSSGMNEYAAREKPFFIQNERDLERYCYFVAGTVGLLLTNLFSIHAGNQDPAQLKDRAIHFGLGLQLVNILKDVASDFSRGACFLPRNLAEEYQLSLENLLSPSEREKGLKVIAQISKRAREHLRAAVEYTLSWPAQSAAQVRLFCAVPLALAFLSLDEVDRGDDTLVLGRTPKIKRETVFEVVNRAKAALYDDAALKAFLQAPGSHP